MSNKPLKLKEKGKSLQPPPPKQTPSPQSTRITLHKVQNNSRHIYIAHHADFQDGLLNVTIVRPFGFLAALGLGATLFLKQIDKVRYVETFTCDKVELTLPPNTPFHLDGDPVDVSTHVVIKAHALGLKVIVP